MLFTVPYFNLLINLGDDFNCVFPLASAIPSCNEVRTLERGQSITLDSLNYPANYANNMHCEVILSASSPDRRLKFTVQTLETECDHDILEIGTGRNPQDPNTVLMRQSGSGEVAPFEIDTSDAWLMFDSDSWQTDQGYTVVVEDVSAKSKSIVIRVK